MGNIMRHLLIVPILLLLPAAAGDFGIQGGGKVTDRSGTATGSSQVVMPANTSRVYCEIQSLTSDLRVAIDASATTGAGSYWLPSGSLFRCPGGTPPTGAISIIGTSGAPFTASEYTR